MSDADELVGLRRLDDAELVRLAAEINAEAFGVLYERHHVVAFSLAARIVGSRDRAQDVVQEAFLNLWREAGRYDPARGSVRTWLMGLVHHRGIDALRRLSTSERGEARAAGLIPHAEASDVTSEQAHASHEARIVRAAIQGLPDPQREIVEFAYFAGWTQAEIAQTLQVPVGTVKSRARAGLLNLRAALLGQLEAPLE